MVTTQSYSILKKYFEQQKEISKNFDFADNVKLMSNNADKLQVAHIETCIELDSLLFPNNVPSNFTEKKWYSFDKDSRIHLYDIDIVCFTKDEREEYKQYILSSDRNFYDSYDSRNTETCAITELAHAYSMQELWNIMPRWFNGYRIFMNDKSVGYYSSNEGILHQVHVRKNNVAQALAKLYIHILKIKL